MGWFSKKEIECINTNLSSIHKKIDKLIENSITKDDIHNVVRNAERDIIIERLKAEQDRIIERLTAEHKLELSSAILANTQLKFAKFMKDKNDK